MITSFNPVRAVSSAGHIAPSLVNPHITVANTLRSHKPLIMNWFKAKGLLSSGAVEGLNLKSKTDYEKSLRFQIA